MESRQKSSNSNVMEVQRIHMPRLERFHKALFLGDLLQQFDDLWIPVDMIAW